MIEYSTFIADNINFPQDLCYVIFNEKAINTIEPMKVSHQALNAYITDYNNNNKFQ
jgi:hypothetical protein